MPAIVKKTVSPVMVIIAFAIVYLVWGSTYFFIQRAIQHIPPLLLGVIRFIIAGLLLMGWCLIKGEKVWNVQQIKTAAVSGLMLLFIGNGAVIWAEKTLPSSLVAVLVSSSPLWFVILDKPKWKANFSNRETILGLIVGFIGVIFLFSEQAAKALSTSGKSSQIIGLVILIIGSMGWAGGSLYSKYKATGSAVVNTTWQMLAAGIAFIPGTLINNEWRDFHYTSVTTDSWLSLLYLIFMGSLLGYSAYVWLLKVRPATQVSTHAYVNPVVAVLLGVFFAHESMSWLQVAGLGIILTSVLLINLSTYKKVKPPEKEIRAPASALKTMMPAPKESAGSN